MKVEQGGTEKTQTRPETKGEKEKVEQGGMDFGAGNETATREINPDATNGFRREVPNGTAARGEEAQAATRIFWPEQPGKEKERHGAAGPPSAARERKASVARIARSGAARVERSEERAGGQKKRES